MDINQELLSRYVDGQVTAAELQAVEQARLDDPHVSMELDEQEMLVELFGDIDPESVSEECLERLYALDSASSAVEFEAIPATPIRRIPWASALAAAAAVLLAVVGIFQLAHKPDVTLHDFARMTLSADGAVLRTDRAETVQMVMGDAIVVGPRERVTYLDEQGARVILMPETRITLGDPRESELLSLDRGTALLTVLDRAETRVVEAGGFRVESLGAEFGIRVVDQSTRAAGFSMFRTAVARSEGNAVTVAVRSGRCQVRAVDGSRSGSSESDETVEALWCVRLRPGAQIERSRIWESPLYAELLGERGHELLAGFYSNESGVRSIRNYKWNRIGAELEMVVTANEIASVARWLVFEAAIETNMRFELVRTRPLSDKPGYAEESIIRSPKVAAGTHVVALSLAALDGAAAETRTVKVAPSRSQLVRLRLRGIVSGTNSKIASGAGQASDSINKSDTNNVNFEASHFELSASLWSARPPAEGAEVVR